jgi:hypothetical protein
VKHLFDVDDVVFVLATDTSQLRHSIKALYGSDFDAGGYLHRFFDQTYRFEKPSIHQFVAAQLSGIDQQKLVGGPQIKNDQFISDAFTAFSLSLRDIEQCIDILGNCVTVWAVPCPLVLVGLLPLIVAQQQRIVPTYSATFRREFAAALNGADLDSWKIDLGIWVDGEKTLSTGWGVFEQLAEQVQSDNLPQLANRNRRGREDQWINPMFRNEMTLRRSKDFDIHDPPFSLIRDYPALVRSVGRLNPI